MKLDSAEEKTWDRPMPPSEGSPPTLEQAFSKILHGLSCQEAGQGNARNAFLKDLSAVVEAAECDTLFEGSGGGEPLRGMPEILGQVAKALEKFAAPPKEKADGGDGHPEVPEKATEVGLLYLKLLGKVETAKSSPLCPAWKTGLRGLAGPMYIFAITHKLKQPWTSRRSQHVAGEVLSLLLRVSECSSLAGFLRGENEDDRGRFALVLGLLKPHLHK